MLLQKGRFIVKDLSELDLVTPNNDGIKDVIHLAYMGQFEFEGNVVPVSRMFIEYYKDSYEFRTVNIYNKNNEQMYFYINSDFLDNKDDNYLDYLAEYIINRSMTLWEYINKPITDDSYDFWWELKGDFFIFFGENKIDLINYFINTCYDRDGGKGEIKRKLVKFGYKMSE